jgi:2-oxoglutarate dehydrogenase E1 component
MNDVFARTSFLQGANASYLAELYAEYQENPSSLDPEWREFFASLDDDAHSVFAEARGPSWAPTNGRAVPLPAPPLGAISEQQAIAAARDSLGLRMLIRAYRTRGHLAAKLDPLELVARREHQELKPKTYGFTKSDYDRPIYIGGALGMEFATLRQVLGILKRTYCGSIGAEGLDRGAHRRPGHQFHSARQAGDLEEAHRGRDLRALPQHEIYRHQAFRVGRR